MDSAPRHEQTESRLIPDRNLRLTRARRAPTFTDPNQARSARLSTLFHRSEGKERLRQILPGCRRPENPLGRRRVWRRPKRDLGLRLPRRLRSLRWLIGGSGLRLRHFVFCAGGYRHGRARRRLRREGLVPAACGVTRGHWSPSSPLTFPPGIVPFPLHLDASGANIPEVLLVLELLQQLEVGDGHQRGHSPSPLTQHDALAAASAVEHAFAHAPAFRLHRAGELADATRKSLDGFDRSEERRV